MAQLSIPKMAEAIMAPMNPFTLIPGKITAVSQIATDIISQGISIVFMIVTFQSALTVAAKITYFSVNFKQSRENAMPKLSGLFAVFFVVLASNAYSQPVTMDGTTSQNYQPFMLGLRTAGMGGAATAFGRDSAMPWVNPAGIVRMNADTISISANALVIESIKATDFIDISDSVRTANSIPSDQGRSSLNSFELNIFPSSFSYTFRLDSKNNHVLALSLVVPFCNEIEAHGQINYDTGDIAQKMIFLEHWRTSTYDFGPSYSVRLGPVTLGLSAFVRYLRYSYDTTFETIAWRIAPEDTNLAIERMKFSAKLIDFDFVAGAQLGPLWGGFYAGVAVHSPTVHLWASGRGDVRLLALESEIDSWTVINSTVEVEDGEYRYPLWFSVGLGYEKEESFAVAVDVNLYLPISEYAMLSGVVEVLSIDSDPATSPVYEGQQVQMLHSTNLVINVKAGAEFYLNKRIVLRAGFFTDFSATEIGGSAVRTFEQFGHYRVDRFGGTLGLAYNGDNSQFQLALLYMAGMGTSIGMLIDSPTPYFPEKDMFASTFMLAFSGRIDAGVLYANAKQAFMEELDHAEESKKDLEK